MLPEWLLQHEATIEPYLGDGAYGPVWGPPVTVRCLVDDERRLVRDEQGLEVVSDTTLYLPPGTVCPAGSKVTTGGRTITVITAFNRDAGLLPTPNHVEVVCR
ncbi:hypothetical protein [Nonomuraea sp. LPB2021202275-12-8]|uniref:hypothetical protein n=1 Tax=Nonomuraea sp. LPB2021202275-12-8 TaxID=3120159 RepID=UPI00300C9A33